MLPRHAVPLTPLESALLRPPPATPLGSTLVEVFILNNLKLFIMNTYEKHRGEGGVMVNQMSSNGTCVEERAAAGDDHR